MRKYTPEEIQGLKTLAEAGKTIALFYLGVTFYKERNYTEAKRYFEIFVGNPNAERDAKAMAQLDLGMIYSLEQDYTNAKKYYKAVLDNKKAKKELKAKAQFALGSIFLDEQDYTNAKKYYENVLKNPNAEEKLKAKAQYNLGVMYHKGEGVKEDYTKAKGYYEDVLKNQKTEGDIKAKAQYILGYMYYYGEGVAQDYEHAIEYFEKAVDNGLSEAISSICDIHRDKEKLHEDLIGYLEDRIAKATTPAEKYICYIELSKEYRSKYHAELASNRGKSKDSNNSEFLTKAREALKIARSQNLSEEVKRSLGLYKEEELLSISIGEKKEKIKDFDEYLGCIKRLDKDGNSRYHNLLPYGSSESKKINTTVFDYLQASNSTEDLREYLEEPKKFIIKALKGEILSLGKPKELFTLSNPSQLQKDFINLLNNINIDQEKVSNIINSENPDGLIDDSNLTTIRQFISTHTSVETYNEFTTNISTTIESFLKKITNRKTYFNLVIKKKLVDSILALDEDSKINFLNEIFPDNGLLEKIRNPDDKSNVKLIKKLKEKLNYNFISENIDNKLSIKSDKLKIDELGNIIGKMKKYVPKKAPSEEEIDKIEEEIDKAIKEYLEKVSSITELSSEEWSEEKCDEESSICNLFYNRLVEKRDKLINAQKKYIEKKGFNVLKIICNGIKLIGVDQSKESKESDKASDLGRAYNRLYLPKIQEEPSTSGGKNEKSNSYLQVNPAFITLSKMYNPKLTEKEIEYKIQDLYAEVRYYTDTVRNPSFHDGKLPKEVYEEGLSMALLQKGSIFDLMEELFGGVIKDLREQEKDNQETNEKGKKRESNNQGKTDDSNNREIGG